MGVLCPARLVSCEKCERVYIVSSEGESRPHKIPAVDDLVTDPSPFPKYKQPPVPTKVTQLQCYLVHLYLTSDFISYHYTGIVHNAKHKESVWCLSICLSCSCSPALGSNVANIAGVHFDPSLRGHISACWWFLCYVFLKPSYEAVDKISASREHREGQLHVAQSVTAYTRDKCVKGVVAPCGLVGGVE